MYRDHEPQNRMSVIFFLRHFSSDIRPLFDHPRLKEASEDYPLTLTIPLPYVRHLVMI